jgi:transcriptional regulator of heat shock response
LQKYDLWVSSATVRNDMAKLEELDLIYQPYNSAWRLPTSKGLRAFISYLMQETPEHFLQVRNDFNKKEIKNLWDFWNNLVFELAKNTQEIAFFISPKENILSYSWIWNFLENNYDRLWNSVFSIIKMLEDKDNFAKFISSFPISYWINIFIWEENILPFLKDYTIIIKKLIIDSNDTYVWLIWSLKMNYSFNISAVNGMI